MSSHKKKMHQKTEKCNGNQKCMKFMIKGTLFEIQIVNGSAPKSRACMRKKKPWNMKLRNEISPLYILYYISYVGVMLYIYML